MRLNLLPKLFLKGFSHYKCPRHFNFLYKDNSIEVQSIKGIRMIKTKIPVIKSVVGPK